MASQGPNSPSTGVNLTGTGTVAWTNPGNITASENTKATVALLPNRVANYIKATNFGFSIPSGATIDGIIVEVEKNDNIFLGQDNIAKLIKANTLVGTNKALAGTTWTTTEAYYTYGGAADLWGESWTDTDINATNFGFAISGKNPSLKSSTTLSVDHIRITVHYTSGGGGGSTASALLLGGD